VKEKCGGRNAGDAKDLPAWRLGALREGSHGAAWRAGSRSLL